jgi:hypothetical protein
MTTGMIEKSERFRSHMPPRHHDSQPQSGGRVKPGAASAPGMRNPAKTAAPVGRPMRKSGAMKVTDRIELSMSGWSCKSISATL